MDFAIGFTLDLAALLSVMLVGLLAVALGAYVAYRHWKARRQATNEAENRVRMSDPILLADVQLLAKVNSPFWGDAMALYCAQNEQGRNPGG